MDVVVYISDVGGVVIRCGVKIELRCWYSGHSLIMPGIK
jgi:hypothetical protein